MSKKQTSEAAEKWRLFPKKTPEEVDRDPVYREARRQLKPLRDAFMLGTAPSQVDSRDALERLEDKIEGLEADLDSAVEAVKQCITELRTERGQP